MFLHTTVVLPGKCSVGQADVKGDVKFSKFRAMVVATKIVLGSQGYQDDSSAHGCPRDVCRIVDVDCLAPAVPLSRSPIPMYEGIGRICS